MGANRGTGRRAAALLGVFLIAMSANVATAPVPGEGPPEPASAIVRHSTVIGARVRITVAAPAKRRLVGVITGIVGETLTIVNGDRWEVTLPRSAITRVERSLGFRPRKILKGFLGVLGPRRDRWTVVPLNWLDGK